VKLVRQGAYKICKKCLDNEYGNAYFGNEILIKSFHKKFYSTFTLISWSCPLVGHCCNPKFIGFDSDPQGVGTAKIKEHGNRSSVAFYFVKVETIKTIIVSKV
jgi:hypothetical protein